MPVAIIHNTSRVMFQFGYFSHEADPGEVTQPGHIPCSGPALLQTVLYLQHTCTPLLGSSKSARGDTHTEETNTDRAARTGVMEGEGRKEGRRELPSECLRRERGRWGG